jgi:excisionase family DNA binding protein
MTKSCARQGHTRARSARVVAVGERFESCAIRDDEVLDWKVRGLSHCLVRATAREIEDLFARRHEAAQRDTRPALTVAELAQQLGKSTHAIYRLLRQGRIPGAFNDGSKTRWYIPADAADRYRAKAVS